jgi:hypothetical protein
MSPNGPARGIKITVPDNLYTVILAVAFCMILAAAVFAAYKCYSQYGTIFKIGMP